MKKAQRLGDVCRMLDLQPYVLRYWETEFPMLRGDDASAGSGANRVYGESEIALLRRIKTLLYEEGYTIAGAKKKLESEPPGGSAVAPPTAPLFEEETPAEESPEESPEEPAKRSPKASAKEARAAAAEAARLDTANDERIETLRRGVAQALEEARAILSLLEPRK